MDLNEFSPAPGRLPQRDEMADAIKQMAREREPSTSRLAGSFSAPQALNHDQLFLRAQQHQLSPSAPNFSPVQPAPMRKTQQQSPTTFLGTMADEFMARRKADRDEYARQERSDRIRQQRQGRQPQAQPQRQPQPEYNAQGQYSGPDTQVQRGPLNVTIGQRPAQSPWGRTTPATPTFPVGMSPEDKIRTTADRAAQDLGLRNYRSGQTPGTFASNDELEQLRNRLSGKDYAGPWVESSQPPARPDRVEAQPNEGTVLGGMFGQQNGKPRSDAFNSGLGHEVEDVAKKAGEAGLEAGELGA